MTQSKIIPIPYFQSVENGSTFDWTTAEFDPILNKTIKLDGPYLMMGSESLNRSKLDIAVAVAEEPQTEEDTTNADTIAIDAESALESGSKTKSVSSAVPQNSADSSPGNPSHQQPLLNDDEDASSITHPLNNDPKSFKTVALTSGFANEDKPSSHSPALVSNNRVDIQTQNDELSQDAPQSITTADATSPAASSSIKNDVSSQSESQNDADANETVDKDVTEKSDVLAEENGSGVDKEEADQAKDEDLDETEAEIAELEAEEERAREEKEAKLESYRKFVAEQENQVDIDYTGIRVSIEANALPSRMYFIMNALSAIIASYGLVVNSPAVVIGAMLVAMMLGPISGAALAIIDYRIPFLRRSVLTILAGVVMVVVIGFIIGFIHKDNSLTNEILSRTQPTSMDLMIALAGGTAGAYAMISPHLSVAVVGVAVATALVPPLAASGILFAHGEASLGFGALLLAITNIIAIQFTNALVLWFSGFRRLTEDDYKTHTFIAFARRNAVPLTLLVVLGGYLSYNLNNIAQKQLFENRVNETIREYFIDKGNTLDVTQFIAHEDFQTVRAVIRGETRPSSYDAKYLEAVIMQKMKSEGFDDIQPVNIQLRYMPVVVIGSDPNYEETISKTDALILNKES